MTRTQAYCEHCQRETLHERDPDPVNHLLHLAITVFLLGCWLPVWLALIVFSPPRLMRCTVCGQADDEGKSVAKDILHITGIVVATVVVLIGGLVAVLMFLNR